ncbi:HmuY family protein [Rubrivirga marina]|uniref:HmuY protein n=1 Tax=Rubrivirga marina TaxID=1196024 RepID=A0A271J3P6_9BACT|nr:HmuY family protein [Rubrivirga marina]PAP78151.1 hypothetical protein BSZ37_17780 [Rubrivirga marina]
MTRLPLFALAGALALSACDATEADEVVDLKAQVAADVEADPTTGRDPVTGAPIANDLFTLYDLDAGEVVLSSSETDPAVRAADSTSTAWDLGFRGTTIIVNGGTSGPGEGSAQLLTEAFADVTEAPATGYFADGENPNCPAVETPGGTFPGAPYAICTGGDNGWYNYNPANNLIAPIPGRTIALTTGDGDYAKVRILSYYRGNPTPPDPSAPSRYYTFEYVVQPDGSRDFLTTAAE